MGSLPWKHAITAAINCERSAKSRRRSEATVGAVVWYCVFLSHTANVLRALSDVRVGSTVVYSTDGMQVDVVEHFRLDLGVGGVLSKCVAKQVVSLLHSRSEVAVGSFEE